MTIIFETIAYEFACCKLMMMNELGKGLTDEPISSGLASPTATDTESTINTAEDSHSLLDSDPDQADKSTYSIGNIFKSQFVFPCELLSAFVDFFRFCH